MYYIGRYCWISVLPLRKRAAMTSPLRATQTGKTARVLLGIAIPPLATSRSPFARLRGWYRNSVLRLLVYEIRNSVHRMAAIGRSGEWVRRGYMVPVPKGLEGLLGHQCQAHKSAYIRYKQKIQAHFPFLSIFDHHLVSQAWRDGWECSVRACTLQIQDTSYSSAIPGSGNSMPLPIAQQGSKCDRLNPLPSKESCVETETPGNSCTKQNTHTEPLSGSPISSSERLSDE